MSTVSANIFFLFEIKMKDVILFVYWHWHGYARFIVIFMTNYTSKAIMYGADCQHCVYMQTALYQICNYYLII